jgi:hypothetical protein
MFYLPVFTYVPRLVGRTYLPTYLCLCINLLNYLNIFNLKFKLICHVATFDYTTCHNLRPYKMNIVKINISKNNNFHSKIPIVPCQILMDHQKILSTWCYHCSCKLVALELHNICSWIIIIELHAVHMYITSHMVGCICCNSCNLSNNFHAHRNMLNCNELQMVIAFQNMNSRPIINHPIFS